MPAVLLLTVTHLAGVDPSLEEAARLSSAWPVVLKRITVPLITPGILLSLVLVFLLSMGELGAPSYLRISVFAVASFTQSAAFYNFGAATAAAVPLIGVVLLGLFISERVLHNKAYSFRWSVQQNPNRVELGQRTPAVLLTVSALAILLVGMPVVGVLWREASGAALADAINRAGASAARSLLYASISATVLCLLGFLLAYIVSRRALPIWFWLDAVTLFLFTLPGGIIGTGLIGLWNRPSTNWLYASATVLIAGLITQYAALPVRVILAGFSQLPISLEEAAEVAGAGWFRRVFLILAPLLRPAILASWTVTFVFCLRDVSLPLLLAPPGRDTLTARTMTLMANGSTELIAALCLMSIVLTLTSVGVLGTISRAWKRAL
jgi:iron(III) transport system permease protein